MDKIEVTQADIDAWETYGPKIFHCEMTGPEALARHRLSHTPQSVEPVATHVAALVEAAYREGWRDGLASERPCSPYRTDDDDWADSDAFAAIAPFTKGQDDEA